MNEHGYGSLETIISSTYLESLGHKTTSYLRFRDVTAFEDVSQIAKNHNTHFIDLQLNLITNYHELIFFKAKLVTFYGRYVSMDLMLKKI